MSHTEARSHFEKGRLNTIDKGVIEALGGRKHSYEDITVITPLNRKVKVRMNDLGDDVRGFLRDDGQLFRNPVREGCRQHSQNHRHPLECAAQSIIARTDGPYSGDKTRAV